MQGSLVEVFVLAILTIGLAAKLISSLRKGKFYFWRGKSIFDGGDIEIFRDKSPIEFWVLVALYLFGLIICLFGIYMAAFHPID